MNHEMKLKNEPFMKILNGTKRIELRLFDEKRRKLKIGDFISFTNLETNEVITTKILDLKVYDNFKELYKNYDKKDLGYKEDEEASYQDMENFYSIEEQNKYKVVAIKIEKI